MSFEDAGFKQPEHFEKFAKLQLECADNFALFGSQLLIEQLDRGEERTAGGIIIAHDDDQVMHSSDDKANIYGIVLLLGTNVQNEYEHIKVGSIVQIPEFSATPYDKFPGLGLVKKKLFRVSAGEIKLLWKDPESFAKCAEVLGGTQ